MTAAHAGERRQRLIVVTKPWPTYPDSPHTWMVTFEREGQRR